MNGYPGGYPSQSFSVARSELMRDWKGEISYLPEAERPARLAKQLALFSKALALTRGRTEVSENEYLVLYRLAEDTIPRHKHVTLSVFIEKPEESLKTAQVAEKTGYPTDTVRRYLQDLVAMRLLTRTAGGEGKADTWKLSDYCLELLEKAAPDGEDSEEQGQSKLNGGAPPEKRLGSA